MLKIIFPILVFLLIVGCSNNGANDTSDAQYMSIAKAPITTSIDISQVLAIEFSSEIDINSLLSLLDASLLDVGILNDYVTAPTLLTVDSTLYPIYLLDDSGTVVPVNISQDDTNANKLIISPVLYLIADTTYTLVVTTALSDVYGKTLKEEFDLSFIPKTDGLNTGSFNVVDALPWSNTGVDVKSDISYEFDGKVAYSDASLPWFSVTDVNTTLSVAGTYEYSNQRITFTPSAPLILGNTYDINFTTYSKTDMYGNDLNMSSAVDRSFIVDTNTTTAAYSISTQGPIDIGYEGVMVRYFTNVFDENNVTTRTQYVAVARSGGVDFYALDFNASDNYSPILTKSSLSLDINSTVTDMQYLYYTNAQKLLIATLNDGIFILSTKDNTTLDVTRLLESESDIYGVGYGQDANATHMDALYAVGPKMGLKTFSVDVDGVISSDKNISIVGDALKVIGTGSGSSGNIYVSDYNNGVRVYNKNGDINNTIAIPGNVKYLGYSTNDSIIFVGNSIGNIYAIDVNNPTISSFLMSTYSSIQDMSLYFSYASITLSNKGYSIVDLTYTSDNNTFGGGVNENIISSFSENFSDNVNYIYIDFSILLSKEGKLIAYFSGAK